LDGKPGYERAAFLGFSTTVEYQGQTPGFVAQQLGQYISLTGTSLVALPGRVPELFRQAFLGEKRQLDTPISVVGVSRIGGEVLGQDSPVRSKLALLLNLLAGVNLSMFLINLLPLPPFDGGHIMAAVWEGIRRRLARLRGRRDPGPVDLAKLMPVAYAVGLVFICYSLLVVVADVVNPVILS
jgi:Zn-dependent protease